MVGWHPPCSKSWKIPCSQPRCRSKDAAYDVARVKMMMLIMMIYWYRISVRLSCSAGIAMPPPLIGGLLSDDAVGRLAVCQSRTPGLRREQAIGFKTTIGTEVAHVTVTRTPLSTSKGQRSRSPGRFTHRRVGASGGCSGGRGNVLAVGNCCYVAVYSAAKGASALTGSRGAGHIVTSG